MERVSNIVTDDNVAIAQIIVHISEDEAIEVVDVLKFVDNKISAIRAYKG